MLLHRVRDRVVASLPSMQVSCGRHSVHAQPISAPAWLMSSVQLPRDLSTCRVHGPGHLPVPTEPVRVSGALAARPDGTDAVHQWPETEHAPWIGLVFESMVRFSDMCSQSVEAVDLATALAFEQRFPAKVSRGRDDDAYIMSSMAAVLTCPT